jgi:hypothetical protein
VFNNSRFLILPGWHVANVGTRILALSQRRLAHDWQQTFSHPVLILRPSWTRNDSGIGVQGGQLDAGGKEPGFPLYASGIPAGAGIGQTVGPATVAGRCPEGVVGLTLPCGYSSGDSKIRLSTEQAHSLPSFFRPTLRTHARRRGGGID